MLGVISNLVAFLSAMAAAPVPQTAQQQSYFPTRVGTKLVYRYGDTQITQIVTAVEVKDGTKTVTITQNLPDTDLSQYEKVVVSEKGLFLVETSGGVVKVAHKDCLVTDPQVIRVA